MLNYIMHNDHANARISVIQAKPADTAAVMELLVGAARWLQSQGSTQWSALLSGDDHHDVTGHIEKGELFLFKDGEKLAGIVLLMQVPGDWDHNLWGPDGHESVVYLHRLAINRDYAGRGLGADMVRWAETGVSFPGKTVMRLDCIASNPKLNAFYSGIGYTFKGTSPSGFCLYEKQLGC
ncbi:GNAT family N-acetyltransferase [Paenibacillus sacheonensis]|uniref:GNAT family N-acetyltransferase n=1 Tax=Paenibacillus sacheonensis TaxID=742054 RepID=A0A7X5BWX6_9BACL|nr:GNAT family N-acetyltransferase [Paenibacillus sacheonensis]MBM7563448.1 ribosomal protein S18 acetylase RimI-like enzyme [Paenibacillus sacheonensis]NBC67997.1 GNAT family N-acetyltransferase [Paenibacillus sacheonensis]